MKDLQITGSWNRIKRKLKKKYAAITEEDLFYVRGKEDQLLGNLQKKTGKVKNRLIEELNNI